MRILTAKEMAAVDRRAIDGMGIPADSLMENAGNAVAKVLRERFPRARRVSILCGKGNNGGDGFVAARRLSGEGLAVEVVLTSTAGSLTREAAAAFSRLPENVAVREGTDPGECDVAVDALLGTGVRGMVEGSVADAIAVLNRLDRPVISVDISSGINGDSGEVCGDAVRATLTVTFQYPKLGAILYPGAEHAGEIVVRDIGIPAKALEAGDVARREWIRAEEASRILPRRRADTHKGDYGHVLIIAGARGMTGAAVLAAHGALRSGAGLVTVGTPASLNSVMEIKLTEAMTWPLPEEDGRLAAAAAEAVIEGLTRFDALILGPGLGRSEGTGAAARGILAAARIPCVVDADGLFALASSWAAPTGPCILTPHPGEMQRFFPAGGWPAGLHDRIAAALDFAVGRKVIVLLKGARSAACAPDGSVCINGSGNPGMATGGTGDVLAGLVGGFLAQGAEASAAAALGAYVHGRAGDRAAMRLSQASMLAGDLSGEIPAVLKELEVQGTRLRPPSVFIPPEEGFRRDE